MFVFHRGDDDVKGLLPPERGKELPGRKMFGKKGFSMEERADNYRTSK